MDSSVRCSLMDETLISAKSSQKDTHGIYKCSYILRLYECSQILTPFFQTFMVFDSLAHFSASCTIEILTLCCSETIFIYLNGHTQDECCPVYC